MQFQDLGRTRASPPGQNGEPYRALPDALTPLWGPVNSTNTGYQFSVVGNAINDSLKWPIAVHGSHYGSIKQNVVFGGTQLTGSGIAVEDGTETRESVRRELRREYTREYSIPDRVVLVRLTAPSPGSGRRVFLGGWIQQPVCEQRRCDLSQLPAGDRFGCRFQAHRSRGALSGANPAVPWCEHDGCHANRYRYPTESAILEFRGNEVYGAAADGLTIWNLGTDGYSIMASDDAADRVKDFLVLAYL